MRRHGRFIADRGQVVPGQLLHVVAPPNRSGAALTTTERTERGGVLRSILLVPVMELEAFPGALPRWRRLARRV